MRRSRAVARRRSATEWGLRAALALIAVLLGCYSVAWTLSFALKGSPERAQALMPSDGRSAGALSLKMIIAGQKPERRARAERLAQFALRQDPTVVPAVVTLGVAAQLKGDPTGARRLFAYSESLSRRDFQTQLWAIEDAVSRNDIPSALRHYDTALRTSRTAPDLLFPVLSSAIEDAAIRASLASVLAKKPAWGPAFLAHVALKARDPKAVGLLLADARRMGAEVSPEASEAAIGNLIRIGAFQDAWRYYAAIRPGANPRMSRDPRFTSSLLVPTAFDWRPVDDAGVTAAIQGNRGGGLIDFAAPPSVGGRLLQQMQMLPPGDYNLEGHSIGIDQPEGSRPYWVLTCRDGREAGRVVLPNSAHRNGIFAGRFSVPSACPVQTLTLVARPSNSISGLSGQIDHVRLYPAQ
jgi:hypothetical protein